MSNVVTINGLPVLTPAEAPMAARPDPKRTSSGGPKVYLEYQLTEVFVS